MKAKVTKLLIKYGNNSEDVKKMIESHFDYALKTYPNAKASFLANVIGAL